MKITGGAKAKSVEAMFSSIAHRYDFLNHFLSLGFDITWRKKAIACFSDLRGKKILDVACGTGDLAITIAKAGDETTRITAGDFSREMIEIGKTKIKEADLDSAVTMEFSDALNLTYHDNSFDGVTCAFGVRNFAGLNRGLSEMTRVLKPGGRMVILEFTQPSNPVFGALYKFYFTQMLPAVGGLLSGNKDAYKYLPDTVYQFPAPDKLSAMLEGLGLERVEFNPLTFGICGIHTGIKK
ncbi:MAG TPA: bifunctional demethylmenaquinone methyltransferase/2-methoxy-6-polyprenyl-1,4-benzoquinol methylase UbiE [Nitrospirae bacterium]|nr:bifunctional demethylmenaquinone methyltransferase/2-methoxy-6-polyprenyl-1,4-benzoquinol methylase UbiE [Nitrospirota bacterium]